MEIKEIIKEEQFKVNSFRNIEISLYKYSSKKHKSNNFIFISHGISEYHNRYKNVVNYFVTKGFNIYIWDQRGHGTSGGEKGHIEDFNDFFLDNKNIFNFIFKNEVKIKNLFLLAHSLGGLITIYSYIKSNNLFSKFNGIIISNPALGLKYLPKLFNKPAEFITSKLKNITIPASMPPEMFITDENEVKAYKTDTLILKDLSPNYLNEILLAEEYVFKNYKNWKTPLLLLLSDKDKITDKNESKKFFKMIKYNNKKWISYEDMFHEILNDIDREVVYDDILTWIIKHFNLSLKNRLKNLLKF